MYMSPRVSMLWVSGAAVFRLWCAVLACSRSVSLAHSCVLGAHVRLAIAGALSTCAWWCRCFTGSACCHFVRGSSACRCDLGGRRSRAPLAGACSSLLVCEPRWLPGLGLLLSCGFPVRVSSREAGVMAFVSARRCLGSVACWWLRRFRFLYFGGV